LLALDQFAYFGQQMAGSWGSAPGKSRNIAGLLRTRRGVQQESTATCRDSGGCGWTLRDGDLRG
jgi:hypothetical protein